MKIFLAISDAKSKLEVDGILDWAYAFNIYPNKNLFTTYKTVSKGIVIMENNASYRVVRIGKVRLKLIDGTFRTLG